jgi:hypothetical protein
MSGFNAATARRVDLLSRQATVLLLTLCGALTAAVAQTNFQIVWVTIGEVVTAGDRSDTRAGKQLFSASDLVARSLANIKVARVEVEPSVIEIFEGERICLSKLQVRATGAGRESIEQAPLSVSVRQDHRQRLGLKRTPRDICFEPHEPGEYPVRVTSLLPARDGSTRGAQLFIRVGDAAAMSLGPRAE